MEMTTEKSQLERIAMHVEGILDLLDNAPGREGLKKTPLRVARALCHLTSGPQRSWNEVADGAVFDSSMDGMILVRDIELCSLCEHHLLPFIGHCHVAYIPNGKLIGLSRIPDVVAFYARRLQLQETLTRQVAEALMELLNAKGVAIIIEAKHLCTMVSRPEKQRASLTTSVMLGLFSDHPPTRTEFLSLFSKHTEASKMI